MLATKSHLLSDMYLNELRWKWSQRNSAERTVFREASLTNLPAKKKKCLYFSKTRQLCVVNWLPGCEVDLQWEMSLILK